MKLSLRIVVSCLALVGALGVVPGVAQAAEVERPAPPAQLDRDHDRGHDRDGRWDRDHRDHDRDRDWARDRRERERAERERIEHERYCRVHGCW
jgi:hypothetical protein